jgi:tetratricopeptide (TPR) repeat protein
LNNSYSLHQIRELIRNSQYNDALQKIEQINNIDDFKGDDLLEYHLLKSLVFCRLGRLSESLDLSEILFTKSQELERFNYSVDALLVKEEVLWRNVQYNESLTVIQQAEKILANLPRDKMTIKKDLQLKRHKGVISLFQGEFDKALEFTSQSFHLAEEIDDKLAISQSFNNFGIIYRQKGDLDRALDFYYKTQSLQEELGDLRDLAFISSNIADTLRLKGTFEESLEYYSQALEYFKEIGNKRQIGSCLDSIGYTYFKKGDVGKAEKYITKSLEVARGLENIEGIVWGLFHLILCCYNRNSLREGQEYLVELMELKEQGLPVPLDQIARYADALVLKMGSRITEKVKAQEILQQLVMEEISDCETRYYIVLNLCELLIKELKSYGAETVQEQIKGYLEEMYQISENSGSFDLFVNSLIFKSRFALVDGDIEAAERSLEEAKDYAQKTDSDLSKRWVKDEIRTFQKEFEKWEDIIRGNVSINERISQARLVEYVSNATRLIKNHEEISATPGVEGS